MWTDLALLIGVPLSFAVIGYLYAWQGLRDLRLENARLKRERYAATEMHKNLTLEVVADMERQGRIQKIKHESWPDEFDWSEVEKWKR